MSEWKTSMSAHGNTVPKNVGIIEDNTLFKFLKGTVFLHNLQNLFHHLIKKKKIIAPSKHHKAMTACEEMQAASDVQS